MFGYVRIHQDELLVKELNQYKSIYCGLCRTLGKEYSILSRFILSYDSTFYAMLLLDLKGVCPGYERKRCRCNPLKKCSYIKNGEDALSKAAALSVISVYFKLIDNIADTKGVKKIFYKLLKSVSKRWCKKAKNNYQYIYDAVKEMSEGQFEAENNQDCHIDMAAEPTAKMLGTILSVEGKTENDKLILSNLGYYLGRWIYLMDAVDDYEEDIKNNNFNPFSSYKGENIKDYFSQVLNSNLAQAYNAWNLLSTSLYNGIIDNILLKGLVAKQKSILSAEENEDGN